MVSNVLRWPAQVAKSPAGPSHHRGSMFPSAPLASLDCFLHLRAFAMNGEGGAALLLVCLVISLIGLLKAFVQGGRGAGLLPVPMCSWPECLMGLSATRRRHTLQGRHCSLASRPGHLD